MSGIDFDIAVFAVNEASTIEACVASIDQACAGHSAHISVLLNGTTDHSIAILRDMVPAHAAMTVYRFPIADKANAINFFLHRLRRNAPFHFEIDGYTRIAPQSLRALANALAADPRASIASGVPTSGRSARRAALRIMQGGAVSGQLHAIKREFADRMVAAGLRLPLGLYRGDGLLGSMAAHDLDAVGNAWDSARIIGVAEAGFALTPLSPFRWRDIERQYRREIRQARGRMENAAIGSIVYAHGYAALPEDADDMIAAWLKTAALPPRSMRDAWFGRLALRQLRSEGKIHAARPTVVYRCGIDDHVML